MAGYTRQSTYTDGDIIQAADSNDEFDQLLAAFNNSTGHAHDGTAAEGPVIGLIGDPGVTTPLNKVVVDDINNQVEFNIDVSGVSTEQFVVKDGVIEPTTDNDIDLGSSGKEFKNLYIDGTANIDSLVADTADINGGTIDSAVIGGTTAAAITGTTITANTSLALASGATVTAILDEDAMTSNSATALATQQSIKAYVDSQVTAQDLDFQADTGGALSIDLDSETMTFTGGTGIDTSGSVNTVTIAIDSTVATLTGTQTLTNKTLTTPIISSISNTGTLTLPTSTDTLVGRATTDTLTNKTLTAPIISTISNTGTLTLPTSTDTLVGRATTDTFTNKTLTSAVLNGTISGTSIKDEDDMVSDSASHLATQQSIKAYVDSQVGANNELSEVLANGNTTGANNIIVTAGQSITVDTISETTAANGVVIDGVTLKDGGATVTADVSFGDNDKAIFGAGSDLQVYHDGSAGSYIDELGTGSLYLRSDGGAINLGTTGGDYFIRAFNGGKVGLYYNTQEKLATTSTGVDITGVLTTDGIDTSADITFGDNDKAIFGAGSDLQIYHDGSNSIIEDVGDGYLDIKTNGQYILLRNTDGNNLAYFETGGGSHLYWNGVSGLGRKLQTTSTGVDITGTLTSDGLTVNTTSAVTASFSRDGTDGDAVQIFNGAVGTTKALGLGVDGTHGTINSQYGGVKIQPAGTTSAFFDTSGGISFYEDTGTTAKLVWKAADERLGIGTDSPSEPLHVAAASPAIILEDTSNAGKARIDGDDGSLILNADIANAIGSSRIGFQVDGAERMRIDSSGNLLCGSDGGGDIGSSTKRFKDLYLSNAVVQDGVKQTTTATTQVTLETFAHASHDGAKVVITAATSADTYVTELLIATNGTTAVATEYGQIGTGSALATYDVDISGADVRILATPASTTSTTFRVAMTLT